MRLAAARTFQLHEDLAQFKLVDQIREPPVAPGAPIIKIAVFADGRVLLEGEDVTEAIRSASI